MACPILLPSWLLLPSSPFTMASCSQKSWALASQASTVTADGSHQLTQLTILFLSLPLKLTIAQNCLSFKTAPARVLLLASRSFPRPPWYSSPGGRNCNVQRALLPVLPVRMGPHAEQLCGPQPFLWAGPWGFDHLLPHSLSSHRASGFTSSPKNTAHRAS